MATCLGSDRAQVTLILAWRVIIEKSAMILSLLVGVQFRVDVLLLRVL